MPGVSGLPPPSRSRSYATSGDLNIAHRSTLLSNNSVDFRSPRRSSLSNRDQSPASRYPLSLSDRDPSPSSGRYREALRDRDPSPASLRSQYGYERDSSPHYVGRANIGFRDQSPRVRSRVGLTSTQAFLTEQDEPLQPTRRNRSLLGQESLSSHIRPITTMSELDSTNRSRLRVTMSEKELTPLQPPNSPDHSLKLNTRTSSKRLDGISGSSPITMLTERDLGLESKTHVLTAGDPLFCARQRNNFTTVRSINSIDGTVRHKAFSSMTIDRDQRSQDYHLQPFLLTKLHQSAVPDLPKWEEPIAVKEKKIIQAKPKRPSTFNEEKRQLNELMKSITGNGYSHQQTPDGASREARIAFFMKKLLETLEKLHSKNTAHLDLRPENIMVSESVDDEIKLLDHGTSQKLETGKETHAHVVAPEFVAPEMVLCRPVTLAADMWSVGVLTYVLLSGISPFIGDSDHETLENVAGARWSFLPEPFSKVSLDAKDFIAKLLLIDPKKRLTVYQAIAHAWMQLADSQNKGTILNTDFLKEFRYRHQWVDRRVFVKSSPDEEGTEDFVPAGIDLYFSPCVSVEPEDDHSYVAATLSLPSSMDDSLQVENNPQHDIFSSTTVVTSEETIETEIVQNGFTGAIAETEPEPAISTVSASMHRSIEDEIANRILSDISEEGSEASDLALIEDGEQTPTGEASEDSQIPLDGKAASAKRINHRSSHPAVLSVDIPDLPPLILPGCKAPDLPGLNSRIASYPSSASNSVAFSPASPKEELISPCNSTGQAQYSPDQQANGKSRSPSGSLSDPLARADLVNSSPHNNAVNGSGNNHRTGSRASTLCDTESLPRYSPDLPETWTRKVETADDNEFERLLAEVAKAKSDFGDRMKELKSLNRKLEYAAEEAETGPKLPDLDLSPYRGADLGILEQARQSVAEKLPLDTDVRTEDRILPLEEFDWDSLYQTGPETYLLQLRDAGLASRIRDYRRQLFGDEPDYKEKSVLKSLSGCISVKERRRYTDVLKEDDDVRANMDQLDRDLQGKPVPAFKRFRRVDLIPTVVQTAPGSSEGHAPVFHQRLHDVTFAEDESISLSATVIAIPAPEVMWFRSEEPVEEDARIKITFQGNEVKLSFNPIRAADAGLYRILASSEYGQTLCEARVKCGDLPERPSRPDVELASDTEVFLTWLQPQTAGCTDEILAYRIEYRRAGEGQWSCPWMTISSGLLEEAAVIRHLDVQGIYQFRVVAKNDFGWGDPSLASRLIQTHPKGAHKLKIELLKKDYVFSIINVPQGSSAALGDIPEDDSYSASLSLAESESICTPFDSQKTMRCNDLNASDDPRQQYQLESEIFRGRFCVIREAVDKTSEHGSHCVVKIIADDDDGDMKDLALKEFETLREIQHENVVSLFDAYFRDDVVLMFMEKLKENLLHRFTLKDYYTEDNVAQIAQQLLCALQWIHFKGIVHLDIQPSNILFVRKRGWHVKLCDFGSAAWLNIDGDTRPNPSTLSLEFAAPELLQHGFVVPASDVWGIGVVIFILLSGFHPHNMNDDETEEQIIRNITQTRLDINYIYTSTSEDALRFITWALKKHPSNRMTTEEGLQHRWLSKQTGMLRRRENNKFSANRLRAYAINYMMRRVNQKTNNNQQLSAYYCSS